MLPPESTCEPLGRAAIAEQSLAGSRTGVFVGQMHHDYEVLLRVQSAGFETRPRFAAGSATSIAVRRIARYFDRHGPALSVDTVCSSSLAAIHLARASLLAAHSEVANAGGVNSAARRSAIRRGRLGPDGCLVWGDRARRRAVGSAAD
ncbi:hypothetical protein EYW47_32230 [Paraburkholderia silviterrae]|uniref:Beta-ketoacyl synthase-like N-terminal domain-containing protein n=1 Tax=Paraburkholderia silviterrae TaxID=2528715 RepID=A0A4R5M1A2_9BURK|nr:hypothetical protein EYW47_32230 [Paraburkholderia silviterrae]